RISDDNGGITVELRMALDWGAPIPAVGREVQQHVAEYLHRLADVRPATIDVVVDEIGPPSLAALASPASPASRWTRRRRCVTAASGGSPARASRRTNAGGS